MYCCYVTEIIEVLISEVKEYLEREQYLKFTISGRRLIPEFSNWRTDFSAFILMGENVEHIPGVGILFLRDNTTSGPLFFIPVDLADPNTDPTEIIRDVSKHIIKFYCGPWPSSELERGMRGY